MLLVNNEATFLAFNVNGDKKITKDNLKELTDEGYKVTFKTTKAVLENANSNEIGMATATDGFEYQVVVEKGEEKFETEWTAVKVASKDAVTKVNKVELYSNDEKWEQAVLDGKVTFKVTEWENAFGDKNTDEGSPIADKNKAPKIEAVKSSDTGIAAYAGNAIKVFNDGKVDFTISFGKDSKIEDYVIKDVEVKTAQKIGSIKSEDKVLEPLADLGEDALEIDIEVLDENGGTYYPTKNDEIVHVVVNKDGKQVGVSGDAIIGQDGIAKAEIKLTVAGEYEVVVLDKKGGKELGKFNLKLVKKDENVKLEDYKYELKLQKDQEAVIDLDASKKKTVVSYDVKVSLDGLAIDNMPTEEGKNFDVKSSNDKIAKAKLEGTVITVTKEDAADIEEDITIALNIVEGAKTSEAAKTTIKVVNTTYQVETLELKDDVKGVKLGKDDEANKKAVAEAVKLPKGIDNEDALKAMIEKVIVLEDDNEVRVEIKKVNGGKSFNLPILEVEEETEA